MANVKALRILLLFACCYSTNGNSFNESLVQLSRFFVVPTTLTSTVLQTKKVTSFTPSTALCYKTVAGITNCRRKRNDVEQPLVVHADEVQPTEPLLVVPTAEAKGLFSVRQKPQLSSPSVSSAEIESSLPMPVTDGVAEVRFNNLESACRARVADPQFGNLAAVALEAFRITVAYSTTVTSTVSQTLTSPLVVTIKTVTFDGCNPSNYVTITPCK